MRMVFVMVLVFLSIFSLMGKAESVCLADLVLAGELSGTADVTSVYIAHLRRLFAEKRVLTDDDLDFLSKSSEPVNPLESLDLKLSREESLAFSRVFEIILKSRAKIDMTAVKTAVDAMKEKTEENERRSKAAKEETKSVTALFPLKEIPQLPTGAIYKLHRSLTGKLFVYDNSGMREGRLLGLDGLRVTSVGPAAPKTNQYRLQNVSGGRLLQVSKDETLVRIEDGETGELLAAGNFDGLRNQHWSQSPLVDRRSDGGLTVLATIQNVSNGKDIQELVAYDPATGVSQSFTFESFGLGSSWRFIPTNGDRVFIFEWRSFALKEVSFDAYTKKFSLRDVNVAPAIFKRKDIGGAFANGKGFIYRPPAGETLIVSLVSHNPGGAINVYIPNAVSIINAENGGESLLPFPFHAGFSHPDELFSGIHPIIDGRGGLWIGTEFGSSPSGENGIAVYDVLNKKHYEVLLSNKRIQNLDFFIGPGGRPWLAGIGKGERFETEDVVLIDVESELVHQIPIGKHGIREIYGAQTTSDGRIIGYFLTNHAFQPMQIYGPLDGTGLAH